jgi:N6-L-threonylcarbamoyladenine synthase
MLEEYAAAPPLPPYDMSPITPLAKPLTRNREKSNIAFSFAGLVTATERAARAETDTPTGDMQASLAVQQEIARAFQTAAVGHVVDKIRQCIAANKLNVKGLVVSGGVGSNLYLRDE